MAMGACAQNGPDDFGLPGRGSATRSRTGDTWRLDKPNAGLAASLLRLTEPRSCQNHASRNLKTHYGKLSLLPALLGLALGVAGFSSRAADAFPLPATTASARVVIAEGDHLLRAYLPDEARVAAVFNRGLTQFTRTATVADAWRSLVATNDTVGIKVFSTPGPLSGTRPAVVAAIVRGLRAAGLPPDQIVIWDKHAADLRAAGFFRLGETLGVRVAGAAEAGFDTNTFYLPDSPVIGSLVWGDVEFGSTNRTLGKKSFVSKLVSQQLTRIISVAPLLNENAAGACGHLFSLALGSVDNTRRFEGDTDRLSVALPEIDALPVVGDRVVLHVTDALLGQYQGGPAGYLQYSFKPEQVWFSRDPVALDVLALKELARERAAAGVPPLKTGFEIYSKAALLQLGIEDPAKIQVERIPRQPRPAE